MDEFGKLFNRENEFNYDDYTSKLCKSIKNYSMSTYLKMFKGALGMHPFDLFTLEQYIKQNNVESVLELGAGTSSVLIDSLNIKRKSFAIESITHNCTFEPINLFTDTKPVIDYINNNKIDFLFIDCEHSTAMANLIIETFLPLLPHSTPVAIHDWFDYDRKIYNEQWVYYTQLIKPKKYEIDLMTDLPQKNLNFLGSTNPEIHLKFDGPIKCLAVLKKI